MCRCVCALYIYDYFIRGNIDKDAVFTQTKKLDSSFEFNGLRFRVNISLSGDVPVFTLRLIKNELPTFDELGVPDIVRRMMYQPQGLVLVTGKTNSGKTTTLNALINEINETQNKKILTLESPVEFKHKCKQSVIVQKEVGYGQDVLTYKDGVKNCLREDCDILVIGEIRDRETAEIAMQAGQTGHYVLSTIHTIDSIEVITRLRKIGVSDYDIASTLATSLSQRLVRRVCPKCAVKREYTEEEKNIINGIAKKYGVEYDFTGKYTYDTVGCQYCNNSGFYGRIGIFEILNMTEDVKELVIKGESSLEIRKKAMEEGYKPLVIDGFNKILNGYTTLKELNSKLVIY